MNPVSAAKKLLIINPGIPNPSRGASSVLFFYYIQDLQKRGYSILNVLLLNSSTENEKAFQEYRTRFNGQEGIEFLTVESSSFIKSGRISFDLNRDAIGKSTELRMRDFKPDLVFCLDFLSARIAMAVFPEDSVHKAVWLGDLNFETQWYHSLYALKESAYRDIRAYYRLALTALRCEFIKREYAQLLRNFGVIVASSQSGESRLRRIGIHSTYLPYPWPEEVAKEHLSLSNKPTFLFLGTLAALGSRSAFHFMDSHFYKKLLDYWGPGGFRILVTGSTELPAWARDIFNSRPEFQIMGFVEDLVGLMQSCHAVLVPIDVPVGNRSRVITAMANRTAVVAHRNVALGNPDLIDGKTCFLADSSDTFVRAMKQAVDDRKLVEQIVQNARRCYDDHFKPEVACRHLHEKLLPLLRA